MDQVLVTGAGGFVGKNLCYGLCRAGYRVDGILRNRIHPEDSVLENIYMISDMIQLIDNQSLRSQNYKYIFHLAWDGVSHENKDDFDLQLKNIIQMNFLMDALDNCNIGKVLVLGSASEYAIGSQNIDGDGFPAVSDLYGFAKASARILMEYRCRKKGIPFNYIIASSIYGEEREDDNILSYTIKKLLKGEKFFYTPLEQIWNYIYIDDLVDGIIKIAEKGKKNEVYTLGDIKNRPLKEYINIIHRIFESDIGLGIGKLPHKNPIVDHLKIDMNKTITEIGFQPKITFDEGIKRTIEYFRQTIC